MARFAVDQGADAIGIVMSIPSPRNVTPGTAQQIVDEVGEDAVTALVIREMPVTDAVTLAQQLGVDVLQMHGHGYEARDFHIATTQLPRVWRATSLETEPGLRAGEYGEELLLLDGARAGAGEQWDLGRLDRSVVGDRWLLAGGLSPASVEDAVRTARPWGVDVSSGVESAPGVKSRELIADFIHAVRRIEL